MRTMRHVKNYALGLSLLMVSHVVQAQGLYFGVATSHSEVDYGADVVLAGGATLDDQGSGFKAFGGYHLNSLMSVEIHYADFGEVSVLMPNASSVTRGTSVVTNNTGAISSTAVEPTSFGFSAILTIPFDVVKPFLKVGMHSWDTSRTVDAGSADVFATSVDGIDFLRGVGFDVPVTDAFSTRLEYEVYDFDDDNIAMLSWGVLLKF